MASTGACRKPIYQRFDYNCHNELPDILLSERWPSVWPRQGLAFVPTRAASSPLVNGSTTVARMVFGFLFFPFVFREDGFQYDRGRCSCFFFPWKLAASSLCNGFTTPFEFFSCLWMVLTSPKIGASSLG